MKAIESLCRQLEGLAESLLLAVIVMALGCTGSSGSTSSGTEETSSTVVASAGTGNETPRSSGTVATSNAAPERRDLSGVDLTVTQGPLPSLSDAATSVMEYRELSPLLPISIGDFAKSDVSSEQDTYYSDVGSIKFEVKDYFGLQNPPKEVAEFSEGETKDDSFSTILVIRQYVLPDGGPMVHERLQLPKTRFEQYSEQDQRVIKLFNERFVVQIGSYSGQGLVGGVLSSEQLLSVVKESHLWELFDLPTQQGKELGKLAELTTADELLPVSDVERITEISNVKTHDQPDPERAHILRLYQARGRSALVFTVGPAGRQFAEIMESTKQLGGSFERLSGIGDKCFAATYERKWASSGKRAKEYRLVFTRGPFIVELTSTGEARTDQYVATDAELNELAKVVDLNLKIVIERVSK